MFHLRVCFLLLSALPACAQNFLFGLKTGIPLTSLVSGYRSETHRYTLGPVIEMELPRGLSVEADLLYKRIGFPGNREAGRWELPLLLKYRVTEKRINPFFEAGASFNRMTAPGVLQDAGAELRHRGTKGAIAGAGLQIRSGAFRITPEFRFTRWVDRNLGVRDAALRSNLSQAELLVGLAFQP